MKIYFDDIESITSPNCFFLSNSAINSFWLTAPGTRLKKELQQLKVEYYKLDDLDQPGLYFIEVNGDPIWWNGLADGYNTPKSHILENLPVKIIELVKAKKLRIIISADREGGEMIHRDKDCFAATYKTIEKLQLPDNSVLIIQGNRKIEKQYRDWLIKKKLPSKYEVKYSNHFDKIFIENNLPAAPIVLESIKNQDVVDFNSLNRTHKPHRAAHLWFVATNNLLDKGLVSANIIQTGDWQSLDILNIVSPYGDIVNRQLLKDFDYVLKNNYPRYIDGDWAITNAANSVNIDIFKNSLISFVTETKFDEDVIFLTEKIFKCLAFGHPMIVLAPQGTLRALEEMGFRINLCGISPDYNDSKNNSDRFIETHRVLQDWIDLSREEKIARILESMPDIEHNFLLCRSRNFYHEALTDIINNSKEYFA